MTTPIPDDSAELQDLAGEYVLGTLSAAQRRDVQDRLSRDPVLRAAVLAWEDKLLPLTGLAEPVAPSPRLWARISRSVDAIPGTTPQRAARSATPLRTWPSTWQSLAFWRGLSAAGFAMAAILAAALFLHVGAPPAAPQYMVVLVAPQSQAPGWVVQASTDREVQLIPLAVAQIPQDKALEFWTKADGWNGPVSLGLVKPGETLRIPMDKLPPLQANQLFELTLEPSTGSPIGKPTGPIQFIGRAVRVM